MQNFWFADEFVEGTVESICEVAVDVRMVLEKEEVELYFGFGVGSVVDYFVDGLDFGRNEFFG